MHIYIKIQNIIDSLTPLLSWLIGCDNTFLVIFSSGGQGRAGQGLICLMSPAPRSPNIGDNCNCHTHIHQQKYRSISRADATLPHTGSRKGLFNAGWSPRWSLELKMAPDILTAPAISRRLRLGDCDIVTTAWWSSSKLSVRVKWSENNQRWKE